MNIEPKLIFLKNNYHIVIYRSNGTKINKWKKVECGIRHFSVRNTEWEIFCEFHWAHLFEDSEEIICFLITVIHCFVEEFSSD